MKNVFIIIFLVSIFNIPLHLKARPMYGAIACSYYLEIFGFENDMEWKVVSSSQVSWVHGFISGMNNIFANENLTIYSVPEDEEEIKYSLLKHCRENPSDSTYDAMLREILPKLEID